MPLDISDQCSVQESEVQDYGWFCFEDAIVKLTFDQGRAMLAQAHASISGKLSKL